MDKTCIIYQPAGIGDVFFTQKISKHMIENGYDVIWPVIKEILWIKDYIEVPN
jgi:hypothetical protein